LKDGNTAIKLLKRLGLNQKQLKVRREDEHLLIPLKHTLDNDAKTLLSKELGLAEEVECKSETNPQRRNVNETLSDILPPHLRAAVPKSLDIVGHVAILELAPELQSYKHAVGKAILEIHKNLKTVLAKSSNVSGKFRLRGYDLIGGIDKTETLHKEYGCSLLVDVEKVYFSPRLAFEHNRVSEQIQEGEEVFDMFAGVGSFSIHIAKKHKNVEIYAADINPDAVTYMKRNIALNRVGDRVFPMEGDVKIAVKHVLKEKVDRVIMNLPENSLEYIETACEALKPEGGIIHFYGFAEEPNPGDTVLKRLTERIDRISRKINGVPYVRLVKPAAPRVWLVAVDFRVSKAGG